MTLGEKVNLQLITIACCQIISPLNRKEPTGTVSSLSADIAGFSFNVPESKTRVANPYNNSSSETLKILYL
jgi:hypothetical protein